MKKFLLSVSGDQKLLANSRLEFIASTVKSSLFLEKGKFYYLCFSVNPFICVSDSSKRMLALKKKPSICRYAKKKKKVKSLYLTSVVPSVARLVSMKADGAPFTPLPLSVLRFTGIQSYGYTDQRKVETDVRSLKIEPEASRSESWVLAN